MKSNYKRLGDYIRQVSVKNADLSTTDLCGVNYQKYFMPSVANVVGTDLRGYKVVAKNQFACNLMHVGRDECLPIALHKGEHPIIVSPAYYCFEVKDESKILPDYLFLWFKRKEFDREACFYTDADVRQGLIKSSFLDMKVNVPPIEEQRKIVSKYQTIEQRIENNRHLIATLEATAQTIYRKMFVEDIDMGNLPEGWRIGTLGEIAIFKNGKVVQPIGGEFPVYGGNGIVGFHNSYNATNVIVIGRVGANCGNIQLERGKCWINDNAMMAVPKDGALYYLYWLLNTLSLNNKSEGSSQPLLTQTILTQIDCIIPDYNTMKHFDKIAKTNETEIIQKRKETKIITELQSLLLASMGK